MEADLIQVLRDVTRDCFGSEVHVRQHVALAGDASTRRYVRLWLDGPGAPATVVAMVLADRGLALSSEELAIFKEPLRELPYLNVHRFLSELGVAVPALYADASDRGILLLEDIGDLCLWEAVQGQPPARVRGLYEQAIEQLLLIQVKGTGRQDTGCIGFQQAFDERLFVWEFEHFVEYGIERRLGQPLPEEHAAVLRTHFDAIAKELAAEPRYLNHRDFHSWNLFVQGDRIRVIDFQDALLAPAPYDLATLLGDRDTPRVVGPAVEAELLQYYQRRWEESSGTAPVRERLARTYFLCALQKALKVVGRFYFIETVKKKPGYLRYIPSTVAQIERILPRFPELAEMAAVLCRYLPRVA